MTASLEIDAKQLSIGRHAGRSAFVNQDRPLD
jgi:hypothetical protein